MRTEILAGDPFRKLYDAVDTSFLSVADRKELITNLFVDTERLIKRIDPIYMSSIAQSILSTGPRCLWCYRTEAHLALNDPELICCRTCIGATYCSEHHREMAETTHKAASTKDGRTEVFFSIISAARVLTFFKKCDILQAKFMGYVNAAFYEYNPGVIDAYRLALARSKMNCYISVTTHRGRY